MTGFVALLRKELLEIVRTWRIWVFVILLLALAIISPLTARYQKELMGSLLAGSGVQFVLPDPTWLDSLGQWGKNLSEIGLLTVILTTGGLISGEARQGTQILVLTKPITRSAYVVAKFVAHSGFLVVTTCCAAGIELALTAALFANVDAGLLLAQTGAWLVLALVLMSCTLLGSASLNSGLAAAGVGLGGMLALLLAGLWEPATRYTPAGLRQAVAALGVGQEPAGPWPVVTGLLAVVLLVTAAAAILGHREL